MSSWRAMATRGGACDGTIMNAASSSPVILSRADGEGPRKHTVHVRIPKEGPISGARSLSLLWGIRMTAVQGDHVHGGAN